MAGEVIYVDFSKNGLSFEDRMSIALHEWIASHPYGVSPEDMKAEIARLMKNPGSSSRPTGDTNE
jgi:hypothetical protein